LDEKDQQLRIVENKLVIQKFELEHSESSRQ
jgi:hypothetical protein